MKVTVLQGSITHVECDAVVVNLFLGVRRPGGATGAVDRALDGLISRMIPESGFSGQLGEVLPLQTKGKIPAKQVIVVGLGRSDQFGYEEVELASAAAAAHAGEDPHVSKVATIVHGAGIGGLDVEKATVRLVQGTARGLGEEPDGRGKELVIVEFSADKIDEIRRGANSVGGSIDQ